MARIDVILEAIQAISKSKYSLQETDDELKKQLYWIISQFPSLNDDGRIIATGLQSLEDNKDLIVGATDTDLIATKNKYNTFIGHWTMNKQLSGDNNTAIGYGSQYSNKTGNGNTSFGSYSLYMNTAGHHNVAIGYSAGQRITGNYNIAIGKETLWRCSGYHNIALGVSTLRSITTGHHNIAIGNEAGNGLQTGSYNLYIGHRLFASGPNKIGVIKIGNPDQTDGLKSIIEGIMMGGAKHLTFNTPKIIMPELPTSDSGLPVGALWNDNGTLKIKQ